MYNYMYFLLGLGILFKPKKLNQNRSENTCSVQVWIYGKKPIGYFFDMRVSVQIPKISRLFNIYPVYLGILGIHLSFKFCICFVLL